MPTIATRQRRSLAARFFRNPKTGDVVVFQMPNIPLALFLYATVMRRVLHLTGGLGAVVSIVGGVGLAVWAVLEIARGESPFRRVLGAVVLATSLFGYLFR